MISRVELIHKIAKLIGDELHGSYEVAGYPIQDACRRAALYCVGDMESAGWSYGWEFKYMDEDNIILDEVEKMLGDRYISNPPF